MTRRVFYPGATIGFIGNGVNMINFVMTAIDYGFTAGVLTTDLRLPLKSVAQYYYAETQITPETLRIFAEQSDFIIYVSDLLDSDTVKKLSQITYVPQGDSGLEIRDDRLIERTFLEQLNINILPYVTVIDLKDVYDATNSLGYPSIIKPIQRGVKNDRQLIINGQADIAKAALLMESGTYILESYLEDKIEIEMLATRGLSGIIQLSPALQCQYHQQILQSALVPAKINSTIEKELERITTKIAENVDYSGIMRINFLLSADNIYVKSISPFLNLAGLVLSASNFDQYQQLLKAAANVTTMKIDTVQPSVLQTFNYQQVDKIKLQWALKSKWQIHFYHHPAVKIAGYVNIPTNSIDKTLEQIDDTSIWD